MCELNLRKFTKKKAHTIQSKLKKAKNSELTRSWTFTTLQKICGWRSKVGISMGEKGEAEAACSK